VLNFPTFNFVYKIVVVKNILVTVTVKITSNRHFNHTCFIHAVMTSINYACVKVKLHLITDFFCVNNKKVKTNDEITDNKDSNNNNKCVSVTLSVKTVKKMGKGFTI